MTSVHVEYGEAVARGVTGSELTLVKGQPRASETLTSGTSNVVGIETAQADEIATVTATGGDVYVAFGATPSAPHHPKRLVRDGDPRDFAVDAGDKIAIVDTSAPAPAPILSPSASWNGSVDTGGAAPTESPVPFGTLVQDAKVTAGFSAAPYMWVHGTGVKISVVGLPAQDPSTDALNYWKECEFFLEGSSVKVTDWSINDTPVRMHDGTYAPQGSIGFTVEIGAGLGAVKSGDARLYAIARGEHGLERLIGPLPIVINVDRSLDPIQMDFTTSLSAATAATLTSPWANPTGDYTIFFSSGASRVVSLTNGSTSVSWTPSVTANDRAWARRPKYFVDPVKGSDGNAGNKSDSGAWQTLLKAQQSALSGALIEPVAGTYFENSNTGAFGTQGRAIEFRPADGTPPSSVIITRSSRTLNGGLWNVRSQRCHFFGMTIDLGKIMTINGSGIPNTLYFAGCRLVDPDGPNGPKDVDGFDIGYSVTGAPDTAAGLIFPAANGSRTYLSECYFENYHLLGAYLYRNVAGLYSADAMATGGGSNESDFYDNVVIDGFSPTSTRSFHQRFSLETELVVADKSVVGGQTIVSYSGSPTLEQISLARPDSALQVLTGALKGQVFAMSLQDNTAKTSTVTGDLSALVAGDKVRSYVIWHADALQLQGVTGVGTRGPRNMVVTRYDEVGPYTQPFLIQAPNTDFSPANTTIKTSGADDRDVTFSSAQTWRDGDAVRLLAGPQIGEARMMDGDGTGSSTGRIKEAFSVPQTTPRACMRTKTWDGLAVYSSRFRKTLFTNDPASPGFGGDEIGQFSSGCRNMTIAHITVAGRQTAALNTLGIRNTLQALGDPSSNATAFRNFKMFAVAMGQIYSDRPFPPRAEGLYIQRVQFMSGTDPHAAGQVGDTTMDPTTKLLGAGALTVGVKPLVPFDLNGHAIASSSPVGGIVQ